MNSFDDFISKYFDATFIIPEFSEKKLLEIVNQIINQSIEKQSLSVERSLKIDEQVKKENVAILNNLKNQLNTIRKVKIFERLLEQYITLFKDDIYFPDILIMVLIEATDNELFNFIRSYSEKFSVSPSTIENIAGLFNFPSSISYQEYIKDLIQPLKDSQKRLMFFLFPHIKYCVEFKIKEPRDSNNLSDFSSGFAKIYEEIESDNRIALDVLLLRFFTSSSIDRTIELITSQDFKEEIINGFSSKSFNLENAIILLSKIFPVGNQHFNLRRISFSWVYFQIKNQNLQTAYNFVLTLSFIAKSFSDRPIHYFGLGERKQAAFQIWHYLERKESDLKILIEILSHTDNSDEFADNILFYSLNDQRTPKGVKITPEIKVQVVQDYLRRLDKKLTKCGSISDEKYFDAPISTIWRWNEAINFVKKNKLKIKMKFDLKEHLVDDLKLNIDFFKLFFEGSVIQDYEDEPATFRPESILQLISVENIKDIIDLYKNEKKFEKLPIKYYQSMIDWIDHRKDTIQ